MFNQKIKLELKSKFEDRIHAFFKHIYHPITIDNLLSWISIDKIDDILNKKICYLMNNIF